MSTTKDNSDNLSEPSKDGEISQSTFAHLPNPFSIENQGEIEDVIQKIRIENQQFNWYLLPPGGEVEGPLSIREIDVKFRTNEIHSGYHVWREGMKDWKKIFEVEDLKDKLLESTNEVLDNVVEEYVKKFGKKEKSQDKAEIEGEEEEQTPPDDNDLYYYNKDDKQYKVFNPRTLAWTAQQVKPTDQQIKILRETSEEVKKEEEELAKKIHHDIAGETDEPVMHHNPSYSAKDIVSMAATDALQKITGENGEEKQASTQQTLENNQAVKTMTAEEIKAKELKRLKKKRYQENKKRKWYQTKVNTFIYIQGLPKDVTHDELKEYFVRCGVIRLDPNTGQEQIKIYTDDEGVPKGDCRIGYAMIESVDMAIENLDGSEFRPGFPVLVQQAEFQQKGSDYVPRKKAKIDPLEKLRIKAEQERQLAWDDDMHIHEVGLKIVILEGMWDEDEVEMNQDRLDLFFEELEIDIRAEIEQNIGAIDKIHFFRDNPKGVIKIRFLSGLNAEECIKVMNGRFFDGRQIKCYFWDGKTDYRVVRESEEQFKQRVDEFGEWLEGGELPNETEGQEEEQQQEEKDQVQEEIQNIQ